MSNGLHSSCKDARTIKIMVCVLRVQETVVEVEEPDVASEVGIMESLLWGINESLMLE